MALLSALLAANAVKPGDNLESWQVIVFGIGVVFVGLVCIVFFCLLMSAIIRAFEKNKKQAPAVAAPVAAAPIANRGEFIAAVSTAIAEELGTDVSAIRIVSVKPM